MRRSRPQERIRRHSRARGRLAALLRLLLLAVACSSPAVAQDPPEPATQDPASHPDRFAAERAAIFGGSAEEKTAAVDRLLATADAAVLPVLRDALSAEDRDLRARITLGILQIFPAAAPEFFLGLLDDAALPRREAALFALGYLDIPEALPRLIAALSATEDVLRQAAARSLVLRGREGYEAAYVRATGGPRPVGAAERRILIETRRAVIADLIAHSGSGASGAADLRRSLRDYYADAEAARLLREAYRASRPEDPAATRIAALGEAMAPWCPRAELPAGTRLAYTLEIENLVAKSRKSVAIAVDAEDFSALHYRRYSLDRVLHLELPLDELLLDPARCAPVLAEAPVTPEGDPARRPIVVRYRLPERTDLRCGIGTLNIAYWEGTSLDGRDVELVIDPESGRPTEERVTDEAGAPVFVTRYSGWLDLPGGGAAPGRIEIDMPRARIGAQVLPMRYELRFRLHDGIWLLDGAEAMARTEAGEEMRALGAVSAVTVVRGGAESPGAEGAPAPSPPAGATPGGGTEGAGGASGGGESTGDP